MWSKSVATIHNLANAFLLAPVELRGTENLLTFDNGGRLLAPVELRATENLLTFDNGGRLLAPVELRATENLLTFDNGGLLNAFRRHFNTYFFLKSYS